MPPRCRSACAPSCVPSPAFPHCGGRRRSATRFLGPAALPRRGVSPAPPTSPAALESFPGPPATASPPLEKEPCRARAKLEALVERLSLFYSPYPLRTYVLLYESLNILSAVIPG